jgi:SNF2 family DNA or RNA helicase
MPNFSRTNSLAARPRQPDVILNAPQIQIMAAHGRLYVTGTHARLLRELPGATQDERRLHTWQLSLTLQTLRAIRQKLNISQQQMAASCTPEVLRWAKAAGEQERKLLDLHRRLAGGYRADAVWADGRTCQPAPEHAPQDQVDVAPRGASHIDETGQPYFHRWVWKYRPPYDHQKVMATVALELDGCAFLCEMGTGKTRAAIAAAEEQLRRGAVDLVLVICPKGVMNTWEREVRQWSSLRPQQLRGSSRTVAAVLREFARASTTTSNIAVVNYDKIATLERDFVQLLDARRVMIILDEMHIIKNPQAAVTQACMELARHAAYRLGMTGTPIANGAYDIWSQWYFVDLGITFGANFVQFRREFFMEYAWSWTIDPADGAHDEIGTRMQLRGVRYRKEDCLDLPPKLYEQVEVEMTSQQRAAYEQMRDELIAWLRGQSVRPAPGDADEDADEDDVMQGDGRVATAANQLVAMMRLTQITSGHVKDENGEIFHFTPNPKLAKCSELVREIVATGRSVIVWAIYRPDIQALLDELRDLNPVRIDGTQQGSGGEADRAEAERAFQAGETKLIVANPAAGGVGINLQRASVAVYYSKGYSFIQRAQSEDRCHRSGSEQHERITYIDLLCSGTIDETVHAIIEGKKDVASAVVDMRRALGV